jgi:protein O-GlcNAc transferase
VTATAIAAAARRAVEDGRLDAARPMWCRLCELEPGDPDHWLILSAIDEHLGFLPAALEHACHAGRLSPEDPDVWLQAAKVRWRMRDLEGAFTDLARSLGLDFTNVEARLLYGAWLMECHRFEEALGHYRFLQGRGIGLSFPDVAKAAACAWCAADYRLLDALNSAPGNRPDGPKSLAAAAARELRTLLSPEERRRLPVSSDSGMAGGVTAREISARLDEIKRDYDWRAFYERRAWVDDCLADDSDRRAVEVLAGELARWLEPAGRRPPHVLDLGCGTGRLGDALADLGAHFLLTGVDHAEGPIRVANTRNRYDNLVCADLGGAGVLELARDADCIVLADVLQHCPDPGATLNAIIDHARPDTIICLAWETASSLVADLGRSIERIAVGRGRHYRVVDIPDRYALMIAGQRRAAPPDGDPRSRVVDAAEETAGRLIEAERLLTARAFRESREASLDVLDRFPGSSQAWFHLGVDAQNAGRFDEALFRFRRALRFRKGFATAWFHIGAIYQQKGALRLAGHAYGRCLQYEPGNFAALHNLAALQRARGDHEAAWRTQRMLLARHALRVDQYIENLREGLRRHGGVAATERLDEFLGGVDWLRAQLGRALERKYVPRAGRLLDRLSEAGEDEQKLLFYRAQLADKSGDPDSAVGYGMALLRGDRGNPAYWQFVASVSAARGRLETARRLWRCAARVAEPDNPLLQNRLFFLNYTQMLPADAVAALHRDWGRALSARIDTGPDVSARHRRRHRKLRIGYVSADFRMHSVAVFLYNILKHRDRGRFEVYCYCSTPAQDSMTTKLRLFSDIWRDIRHLPDDDAARLIEHDGIDILVDLSGHTAGNRLPVFVRKPAPVQCTYLGYPNTTGLEQMDYRITDADADPVGMTEHLHSETLVRLSSGFLSYSRHSVATPVTIYRAGDPARHYTFACCNNVYKINDRVMDVWSEILRRLPASRLLIKSHNLNNTAIVSRYRRGFEKRGIDAGRVHLMNTIDGSEHQNLYNNVDIALDPFPYNGTTTTCDALWMGVPVLTLAGDHHAARVGVSIMRRIGLCEWIAEDEEDYIKKAVLFASDGALLREVRLGMRRRMRASDLMDPNAVIRDLEAVYLGWWGKRGRSD